MTRAELNHNQSAVVLRAIRLAGSSAARWIELLPCLPNLLSNDRTAVYEALATALGEMAPGERQLLGESIRDTLRRHERHATAAWALPADQLQPLRAMMDRYAVADPVANLVWLFDAWMQDRIEDAEAARARRVDGLRDIVASHGMEGVLRLGMQAKYPYQVADALEALSLQLEEIQKLAETAANTDPTSNFAVCLSRLHFNIAGGGNSTSWLIQSRSKYGWNVETTARLLLYWPTTTPTWHCIRRLGEDVVEAYWRMIGAISPESSKYDLLRAQLSLLRYEQGLPALHATLTRLKATPTRMLLRILDAVLRYLSTADARVHQNVNWEIEQIFQELDNRKDVSDSTIAQREFPFLPALESGSRPLRLHKLMSEDPALYHSVLCRVFRKKNEVERDSEPTDGERTTAHLSYTLLSKFDILPGQQGSDLDSAPLTQWIDRLRALADVSDHAEIADIYIGHLLSHAPLDPDGGWPHRVVRDQIERLQSDAIERGIQVERFNMRGVHSKSMYDGGGDERALAAQNRAYAQIASAWPRTATMLRAIADDWDIHASDEDIRAAQRKLKS